MQCESSREEGPSEFMREIITLATILFLKVSTLALSHVHKKTPLKLRLLLRFLGVLRDVITLSGRQRSLHAGSAAVG